MAEQHEGAVDADHCPNCGHHITHHPGNVLCFNSEHMRCALTPEDIRAVLPPAPTEGSPSVLRMVEELGAAETEALSGRVCTDPDCTIPRRPGRPMHGPHDFRASPPAPTESIVCADPNNCDREHVGGMGGTPVHLPPDGIVRPDHFDTPAPPAPTEGGGDRG